MKLTISGSTPSQKNRKIISVNRATGRPFLRTAPQVKVWHEQAVTELREQFKGYRITDYPISIAVVFYYDSNRRRDLDNGLSSIMDALVDAGIIEDDNYKFVDNIDVSYGGYDKINPRCEIYIDEL